jgi:hypothetical protein
MSAIHSGKSRPFPAGKVAWAHRLAIILGVLACAPLACALTISNVKVVNVTPTGFSVLWVTSEPATPSITVYSDAGGGGSLTGQVGIETFPLYTGKLGRANAYEKRISAAAIAEATRSMNLNLVRVTGCPPGSTLFFRVRSSAAGGGSATFPESGALPSATLPRSNSFVAQSRQLIVDLPTGMMEGRVVTLSTAAALSPLAAVAGDGVGPNQVFFNLSELFTPDGSGNLASPGDRTFTIEILGPALKENLAAYTLRFGSNFVVAETDIRGFAREDRMLLTLGTTPVLRGDSGSVPIGLKTGARFNEIRFRLLISPDVLPVLRVESSLPEILTASLSPVAPGAADVSLRSLPGTSIPASPELARLVFTSAAGTQSALVNLALTQLSFDPATITVVKRAMTSDGRVFVVGDQPILGATFTETGDRELTLYGIPGLTYITESTGTIPGAIPWNDPVRITLDGLSQRLNLVPADDIVFLRARREP